MGPDEFSPPFGSATSRSVDGMNGGIHVINLQVEYTDSDKLKDLVSIDTSFSTLLACLDSEDWIVVCEALNNVHQLSIFHKEKLNEVFRDVLMLTLKALKNPRSAVCKTAIMTSGDIILAYKDSIVDLFDPHLFQLLLKSSQDKRFVCQAAEASLVTMTTFVSPSLLLPKLQPYLKHKNPRIRAKASMCFCRTVSRLGLDGIKSYGIDKLIHIAASQLSDQLPESREAARKLALELQTAHETSSLLATSENENWESFCQSELFPLNAQAIIRVTSVAKDGVVSAFCLHKLL